ncbi:MAG: phosphatase PAP2 family protein, partial [Verrucomicrobiota bacterium]
DRLDLSDAVASQASTTSAQMVQAKKSYAFNVFYFSDIMGPKFTPKNYPKTAAFFQKLAATANVVIVGLKNHYARERPFQAHPDQIKLFVRNEPGFSYPSGHTTRGRLFALVMGELCPSKQQALEASGEQVGVDRILAGEHYRTDLEAGHRLAKMMFLQLQKDPDFLAAVNALRQSEWAASPK